MLEIFALFCLLIGLILLGALSYIDLKTHLLPNELVLGFACGGFVFHLCTLFHYLSLSDMALGALIGGGMLYLIRGIANYWYDEDTLGLGDVKLLAAGGLWLGPEFILIAAAAGAMAGFFMVWGWRPTPFTMPKSHSISISSPFPQAGFCRRPDYHRRL